MRPNVGLTMQGAGWISQLFPDVVIVPTQQPSAPPGLSEHPVPPQLPHAIEQQADPLAIPSKHSGSPRLGAVFSKSPSPAQVAKTPQMRPSLWAESVML